MAVFAELERLGISILEVQGYSRTFREIAQ
jgi:hypothetical protein